MYSKHLRYISSFSTTIIWNRPYYHTRFRNEASAAQEVSLNHVSTWQSWHRKQAASSPVCTLPAPRCWPGLQLRNRLPAPNRAFSHLRVRLASDWGIICCHTAPTVLEKTGWVWNPKNRLQFSPFLLSTGPWANHISSLNFNFLFWKMGIHTTYMLRAKSGVLWGQVVRIKWNYKWKTNKHALWCVVGTQ